MTIYCTVREEGNVVYSTLTADAAAAHRRELRDAAERDRRFARARAAARARKAKQR